MGWFDSHSIDAGLRKMMLVADGTVGDMGEYSILNDAIAAGWTKIFLGSGAYMDANLSISSHNIIIFSISNKREIDLGNYSITISGHQAMLSGFTLDGTNANITISGVQAVIDNVRVINSSGDGINLTAASGRHRILNSEIQENDGDGIECSSGNQALIIGNTIIDNGAYGIDDNNGSCIAVGNDLQNNTSGSTSGVGVDTGNLT